MEEMHNQPDQAYQPKPKVLTAFNPYHVEYDEFEKAVLARLYETDIYDVVEAEFIIPKNAETKALTSINYVISKHVIVDSLIVVKKAWLQVMSDWKPETAKYSVMATFVEKVKVTSLICQATLRMDKTAIRSLIKGAVLAQAVNIKKPDYQLFLEGCRYVNMLCSGWCSYVSTLDTSLERELAYKSHIVDIAAFHEATQDDRINSVEVNLAYHQRDARQQATIILLAARRK